MHAGSIETGSNEARVLAFLVERTGRWFSTLELIQEVGVCNPATHISGVRVGLRKAGRTDVIEHKQRGGCTSTGTWTRRWLRRWRRE